MKSIANFENMSWDMTPFSQLRCKNQRKIWQKSLLHDIFDNAYFAIEGQKVRFSWQNLS